MQRDIVMRWISQISAIVARLLRRDPTLSIELARQYLQDAEAQVLGPLADLIARLDAESAAQLLDDANRIFGYAQTLALRSALARAADDATEADALADRAITMGEEAVRRSESAPEEWTDWISAAKAASADLSGDEARDRRRSGR